MHNLTLIGYGEAGSTFARAGNWGIGACVYDIKPLAERYARDGVTGCATTAEAVRQSSAIISVVTADQALIAAQNAAQHLPPGTLYFDLNSVAPETKCAAAASIAQSGGRYVDVAVMAPVEPARLQVPLLLSGADAAHGADLLRSFGFTNVRVVGDTVGRASTIKMLRSVIYKGVEALTAECLMACERAGVTDEVLSSFGNDWSTAADYRLDRMLVHGTRRAAEMTEAVKTLAALGIDPLMTRGTVQRQAQLGALAASPVPVGLKAKLERLTT